LHLPRSLPLGTSKLFRLGERGGHGTPAMPDDPSKPASSPGSGNRRAYPRYAFTAAADVTEVNSGARLAARATELSMGGCYLDMLNPFPPATLVRVRIVKDNVVFEAGAKVIYVQTGFGMGMAFVDLTPAQRAVLKSWLAELSA
jgi:hypothetical protein